MYNPTIGEKIIVEQYLGAICLQSYTIATVIQFDEKYIYCQVPYKYKYITIKFSRKTGKEFKNKGLIRYELTNTRAIKLYDEINKRKKEEE